MIKNDECLDDLQNGLFIIQKKNGFKFGIDAVLLSDFAKETRSKKHLIYAQVQVLYPCFYPQNKHAENFRS